MSRVATERGERYRKQLASHFGNKIEVAEEPSGTVLKWGFGGTTTLTVEAGALVLRAAAEDACAGPAGRLYATAMSSAATNAR